MMRISCAHKCVKTAHDDSIRAPVPEAERRPPMFCLLLCLFKQTYLIHVAINVVRDGNIHYDRQDVLSRVFC